MDLSTMFTDELLAVLSSKGISKEICDQLEDNDIDGFTLKALVEDINEFVTVIPKSGHRLQLKRLVKTAIESDSKARKVNSEIVPAIPSSELPLSITPVPAEIMLSSYDDSQKNNKESAQSCEKLGKLKTVITAKKQSPYQSPHICEALPQNLPFPEKLSIQVEAAIKNGSVAPERTQLIADVGAFYFGLSHHPRQGDYKRIAILVCEKYPELMDANPSSYWVSIQKQLSQYFRNLRRRTASKASPGGNLNESAAKKAKLNTVADDPQSQKRNLELLKDTKKGSMSNKTYVGLVEDTFEERRNFIETKAASAAAVLEMCPYLAEPKFVRKEVCRILGGEVTRVSDKMNDAQQFLRCAFNVAMGKEKEYEMSSEEIVTAVELVERKTKNKKGPLTSVLKFKDPSARPDALFKDKLVEFRLVAVGSPGKIEQLFVAGEDQAFVECDSEDLVEGFINLISAYYVFDVAYPDSMAGFLLFLQDIGLKATDNAYRGTKYSTFMSKLRA